MGRIAVLDTVTGQKLNKNNILLAKTAEGNTKLKFKAVIIKMHINGLVK